MQVLLFHTLIMIHRNHQYIRFWYGKNAIRTLEGKKLLCGKPHNLHWLSHKKKKKRVKNNKNELNLGLNNNIQKAQVIYDVYLF